MYKITCITNGQKKETYSVVTEHGLAMWIESNSGVTLFDTGQTPAVLHHNLTVLRLNPVEINNIAFSHAHYDHTGGLLALADYLEKIHIYAHPDLLSQRYSLRDGKYFPIGVSDEISLRLKSTTITYSANPVEISPGLWTSGEIRERSEMQGRSANHFQKTEMGWEPDTYRDDLSLILHTQQGLILICGCCHAGLLNTLAQVSRDFSGNIIAIIGGIHLNSAGDDEIEHVIFEIQHKYKGISFHLNHCTGENAIQRFREKFKNVVAPFYSGDTIIID